MKESIFKANQEIELQSVLAEALQNACNKVNFDLRCLDWFSYTPDFFIQQKNIKAA